jgi:hypothetical protein
MKLKEAREITGGLSKPSKMPGRAYSIPAQRCKIGAKLAKKEGSVCHGCYALKGFYRMAVVKQALERRYLSLSHASWTDAMVVLIKPHRWFRWHDAGDLQSVTHLRKICDVATQTPDTHHWLPTREVGIVRNYTKAGGVIPANLVVRVSSPLINGEPLAGYRNTSTVVTEGGTCPAPTQGNQCLDCRACWDKEVKNVSYTKH